MTVINRLLCIAVRVLIPLATLFSVKLALLDTPGDVERATYILLFAVLLEMQALHGRD